MKKIPFRLIMGKNTVEELLLREPRRIATIYLAQGVTFDQNFSKSCKIPVKIVSKHELTKMVESESHQGIVAAVYERGLPNLKEFLIQKEPDEKSLVLILDSILDPHNLGAILRSAECFGVDAVIFSKNRGTDVTATVSKVSAGGSELVTLIKVANLAESVSSLKDAGFSVISAHAKEKSISLYNFQFPKKTALILGSEGKGIQKLLCDRSDFHLMIPMCGQIDSLNVSQAAAVFLSFYNLQNR
jgi:23S rRNA (guanosine2251-2'-O)-methyltransferase